MDNIASLLDEYLRIFPGERPRLRALSDLITHTKEAKDLVSRENYVGHITASGFVISRDRRRVLLLFHKALRRHLQPGGHFEAEDVSLVNVAAREIKEETDITELEYLPFHYNSELPIDIDSHHIPEDRVTHEKQHWHHDFRYVFLCNNPLTEVRFKPSESLEYQWLNIAEMRGVQTFALVVEKIQILLSREFNVKRFYELLIREFTMAERPAVLAVAHLLPDSPVFLQALKKAANVLAVIPKPKSIVETIYQTLDADFKLLNATRENLQNPDFISAVLEPNTSPTVIFDIGGYFAPVINELVDRFPGAIVGVVEDTENGHQKYQSLSTLSIPVYSVARSPLKDYEDFLVGQSVVFSADAILRELGRLIQYLYCSVIGFGKIGKSIAHHLLLRGIKANVLDTNPLRRLEAYNKLCAIPPLGDIFTLSDVIFSATGNHFLGITEFRSLKPGCFVFSVTSSDDEMDLRFLDSEYQSEQVSEHVTKYSGFANHFFLVNKGNAVNFVHKAVLGDFIHLVRGEMLSALDRLISVRHVPGIHEMPEEARKHIASLWLGSIVDDAI